MVETALFYILSLGAIAAALLTVTLANPVSSALALILCLVCLAGLFAQLAAGFVAILQVLVYAGAIMVLFLFVVMLLNLSEREADEGGPDAARYLKAFICFGFVADLWVFADLTLGPRQFGSEPAGLGSLREIGRELFTRYMVPFEVTSLLLTAAVVGVVLLTRRTPAGKPGKEPS